jgi:large subunit ribosomal protein L3
MAIGLIGRKAGMTRVFVENGESVPVTVVEVLPNRVTRVRTAEADGYSAVQVTTGAIRSGQLSRS